MVYKMEDIVRNLNILFRHWSIRIIKVQTREREREKEREELFLINNTCNLLDMLQI